MGEILIIKTGHCETFCEFEDRGICSLGDVLRSSFLLNYFRDYKVTWVTDAKAISLFQDLDVEAIDWESWESIDQSKFERIINLEKKGILLESDFEGINSSSLSRVREISTLNNISYQERLCLLLGLEWERQPYSFRLSKQVGNGVGLNWKVGEKFPQKMLEKSFWLQLEQSLSAEKVVKWQEGFDNLNEYIDWIDSLETLITLDSLGLHIGIALNKKVIALFGPTNIQDIYIHDKGVKLDIRNQDSSSIISKIREHL